MLLKNKRNKKGEMGEEGCKEKKEAGMETERASYTS